MEDKDGWIEIDEILKFYRLKTVIRADIGHVQDAALYSTEFEIDSKKEKIRKKKRDVNGTLSGLGFDHEGIRNMNLT